MVFTSSAEAARLIRELRESAGLTQRQLAERVGTTQSVISRLESDDYAGHSLSMLYRIGSALNRRITVGTQPDDATPAVQEGRLSYGASGAKETSTAAASVELEIEGVAERLAQRFAEQGVTKADVEEAIRWARRTETGQGVAELRGALSVGRGSVVDDVRRARARRGRASERR